MAAAGDHDDHRIHQERHVIGDDLGDSVTTRPAVRRHRRGEHLHLRLARFPIAREAAVVEHCAHKVGGIAVDQIAGLNVVEVVADEVHEPMSVRLRMPRFGEVDTAHEQVVHNRITGQRCFGSGHSVRLVRLPQ